MSEKSEIKQKRQKSIKGYAPVNGLEMYYEIHGKGAPLVLIHGGGSTIETSFGCILPLLAQKHKVIAVELQAHGRTNDRDQPESFEQDADDVAGLLQYLGVDKAHFLGFSNGGNTAMQIAIRQASLVNKLIVVSSFYKREGMLPGFFEGLEQATLENMPEPLKTAYLQVGKDQKGLQAMFDKDRERMLGFRDWRDEDLNAIRVPVLLVVGDQDVVTLEHAVKMRGVLSNARLMVLPGTHGSFIGEICAAEQGSRMPEWTAAIMEEFLKK